MDMRVKTKNATYLIIKQGFERLNVFGLNLNGKDNGFSV
jgi:hypothetical protein